MNKLINSARFNNVTIIPMTQRIIFKKEEFLYFPITLYDDVRYTCENIVKGNWILKNICEKIKPLKGSDIKKMMIKAVTKEIETPNRL